VDNLCGMVCIFVYNSRSLL